MPTEEGVLEFDIKQDDEMMEIAGALAVIVEGPLKQLWISDQSGQWIPQTG